MTRIETQQFRWPVADAGTLYEGERGEALMKDKKIRLMPLLISGLLIMLSIFYCSPKVYAEDSLQKAARINEGCLRCHGASGLKTKFDGKPVSLFVDEAKYGVSMHGTMPCTYCHTNISDYPHQKALKGKSLTAQVNNECRRCHKDITSIYSTSVHSGRNVKAGKINAYCSDCHGIHTIYKKEDPNSTVNYNNSVHTCAKCHDEVMVSYEESYHGKSVLLGGKQAANCLSCHGSHAIVKFDESSSPVAKQNVPQTCAKCHLYPLDNFAKGKEHFYLTPKDPAGAPMFYTLMFFTWLTIIVVTLLIIHMEMELYRKYKNACNPDESDHDKQELQG